MASKVQSATADHRPGPVSTGSVQGNQRLIVLTRIVLLTLPIVEALRVPLGVRKVIPLHRFAGLALIPLVLLKLAGTIYGFARSYPGDPAYVSIVATPVSASRFHKLADRLFRLAPVASLGTIYGFTP